MKFICLLIFASLLSSQCVTAQQSHFLFIQSESRQPFNVTLNNKVFSSTATGYVIIPKLTSGQYNISVGFGGNTIPDQSFAIQIDQKDVGFSLKDFSDKGWALYNLQTMDVTYAGQSTGRSENAAATPAAKAFQPIVDEATPQKTSSSASTANTPTVAPNTPTPAASTSTSATSTPPSAEPPITETPVSKPASQDPPAAVPASPTSTNTNSNPANTRQPIDAKRHSITKISELKGGEAYYITYVDDAQLDTINVLIPYLKIESGTAETTSSSPQEKSGSNNDLKFLNIETGNDSKTKTVDVPAGIKNDNVSSAIATPCNKVATQDDFLKLRKKMAAAPDNDAMLSEAKKYFKTTCFATSQVKDLAYLFLTDEARYHFFDTAYPFVTDKEQFPQLSIMLTNDYFLNRFKAMLIN